MTCASLYTPSLANAFNTDPSGAEYDSSTRPELVFGVTKRFAITGLPATVTSLCPEATSGPQVVRFNLTDKGVTLWLWPLRLHEEKDARSTSITLRQPESMAKEEITPGPNTRIKFEPHEVSSEALSGLLVGARGNHGEALSNETCWIESVTFDTKFLYGSEDRPVAVDIQFSPWASAWLEGHSRPRAYSNEECQIETGGDISESGASACST